MPYGLFHWLNYMWMLVIAPFGSYIWGDFWLLRSRQKEEQHVFLFLNFLVEIKFFYALTGSPLLWVGNVVILFFLLGEWNVCVMHGELGIFTMIHFHGLIQRGINREMDSLLRGIHIVDDVGVSGPLNRNRMVHILNIYF